MSTQQHAPSPDYSIGESTVTPALSICPDCGDLHMAFYATAKDAMRALGEARCDTCAVAHQDELATAKRITFEQSARWIAEALQPGASDTLIIEPIRIDVQTRSGGMNDPREILCDCCTDVAATYTGCVDSLDQREGRCDSCGARGRIDIDQDDEGRTYVRFRMLGGQ